MNKNHDLFERSLESIPGGVNSPVRAFKAVGGTQIFVESSLLTYMVPAAAYVLIMMATSIIFVFILRKNT